MIKSGKPRTFAFGMNTLGQVSIIPRLPTIEECGLYYHSDDLHLTDEFIALKQKLDEANKLLIRAESWIGPHAQLGQLGAAIWFEDLLRYRKDENK